jgi:hypothetical protein
MCFFVYYILGCNTEVKLRYMHAIVGTGKTLVYKNSGYYKSTYNLTNVLNKNFKFCNCVRGTSYPSKAFIGLKTRHDFPVQIPQRKVPRDPSQMKCKCWHMACILKLPGEILQQTRPHLGYLSLFFLFPVTFLAIPSPLLNPSLRLTLLPKCRDY